MPLPDTEAFSNLLSSLSLSAPGANPERTSVVAVPAQYDTDNRRGAGTFPEVLLWHSTTTAIKLEALVTRIAAELRHRAHITDRQLILTILAFYCLHPKRNVKPVTVLNSLLDSICDADLLQFYILPARALPGFQVEFGSFTMGVLNIDRLRYLSERAGSDYHDRYGARLEGRMAIERKRQPILVLPLNSLPKDWRASHGAETLYRLVDEYFNRLSTLGFEEFWRAFVEEQDPLIAYGAPYLATEPLLALPWTDHVSIFSRIGGHALGWVAPGSHLYGLDLAGAHERIPAVRSELQTRYGFDGFRDSIA